MVRRYFISKTAFHRTLSVGAVAFAGVVAVLANGAHAAPLSLGKGIVVESSVVQVRDGCGQGMRYSERRDACVEDFDGGPRGYYDRAPPPPPPMYDRRPPPDYDRRPPPEYSRGPDRGDADVATGALIGGAVGALIGSSIRNDADQRQGRR